MAVEDDNAGSVSFNNGRSDIAFKFDAGSEAIWATAKNIADLFETDITSVRKHIQHIYVEDELNETATSAKFALVQTEGDCAVKRDGQYRTVNGHNRYGC